MQHPKKVEDAVKTSSKNNNVMAVEGKTQFVDHWDFKMEDTELDYEEGNDDWVGDVAEDNEKTSESWNPKDEIQKFLELENRAKDNSNEYKELENRNLTLRNEELLRENVVLGEEEGFLRGEKKKLEMANQDLHRELEGVKRENDHLKQKNTRLVAGDSIISERGVIIRSWCARSEFSLGVDKSYFIYGKSRIYI